MKLEQFQVNTKFLNTLPPEWSKFVTDVKLVRDLHTTNIDQLHAYLGTTGDFMQMRLFNAMTHHSIACFKCDDPIDVINHMMSFLTAVVTSRYPTTNNQLRNSSNPRQQATINNGRVTLQPIQGRQTSLAAGTTRTYTPRASGSNSGKQRTVILRSSHTGCITLNAAYYSSLLIWDAYGLCSGDELNTSPKLPSGRYLSHYGFLDALVETYKQLYDSIKPARIRSKEQCDDLINQVNLKSVEISDLNASLQEKVLEITALKDDLRKLKGKALVDNAVTNTLLIQRCLRLMYAKLIQELLTHISKTCLSVNNTDRKLVAVTPKNKNKRVRFTEPHSGNTKKDKILQTPSSTQKNNVEDHPRKVKSSLKNKDCVVAPKGTANVQYSKPNVNSELKCVKCNGCMLSDNHDLCILDFINNVNARVKSNSLKKRSKKKVWKPTGKVFTNIGYIWRPTGQTFTIV
ncbi:hypothetical protein Tco_1150458 [Tanacetum coccineum]